MKYYCSKCGAELMRGGRFCPSCGAQIIGVAKPGEDVSAFGADEEKAVSYKKDEQQYDTGHRFEYVPGEEGDYEEPERHGPGLLTILLGILVAATAVVFLMVFLRSRSLFGDGGSGQVLTASRDEAEEEPAAGPAEAPGAAVEETVTPEAEPAAEPSPEEEAEAPQEEPEEPAVEEQEEEPQEEEEPEERVSEEERRNAAANLGNGDYILSESNSRYYSRSELENLSDREVLLAINEIYARRGRKFAMQEYRDYFESKSWYHGTIEPADFDAMGSSAFNEYENGNRLLLVEIAEDRGIR